jgi:sugar lactone lactonase YvrE
MRARILRIGLPLLMMTAVAAVAVPAHAKASSIVLPGASSAEGIAAGEGSTFYAGDLFRGDIFRGNVEKGTASLFIHAPDGRMAVGMKADVERHLLFVAGGSTGQAYVYDTDSAATVAVYQFASSAASFINDVTLTAHGAWFTDSLQPLLYFIPFDGDGTRGSFSTLALTGPAADTSGQFNNNGIAVTADGKTLLVGHTAQGAVNLVDPDTGASSNIIDVDVSNVDGILLRDHTLWAVQNFSNKVTQWKLDDSYARGTLEETIGNSRFEVPTTAAIFGHTLAVVNGKFNTGFPPTASQYEVILVGA